MKMADASVSARKPYVQIRHWPDNQGPPRVLSAFFSSESCPAIRHDSFSDTTARPLSAPPPQGEVIKG